MTSLVLVSLTGRSGDADTGRLLRVQVEKYGSYFWTKLGKDRPTAFYVLGLRNVDRAMILDR